MSHSTHQSVADPDPVPSMPTPTRLLAVSRVGSVAECLACWTQAQKAWVQIAAATLSGNSLRQTAHTHRASLHKAAKLLAALLRVWQKEVAAYRQVYDKRHLQADCQEPESAQEPYTR